jgi:hypothetical protein
MRIRKVIVTKTTNVSDPSALGGHPNVKKTWDLGCGFVLFEFYHPVFNHIHESDLDLANAARNDPAVRTATAAAVAEERQLLAPLYQQLRRPSDALILLIPSKTTMYYFLGLGKGRIQWPEFARSTDWEVARSIRVAGRLFSVIDETIDGLNRIFKEWSKRMVAFGVMTQAETMVFSRNGFSTICEFTVPCGDAMIALFALLSETRYITSLDAVGFFLPDDPAGIVEA